MPLSNEAFDKASAMNNPKIIDFIRRNKKAYTESELSRKFKMNVSIDLAILSFAGELEMKLIDGETYYRAKSVPKNPR